MAALLGLLTALYGAAYLVDRVRGVTPRTDVLASVRAWDDRHEPDDAPLWAEVCGVVFAAGLLIRAGAHIVAALIDGSDPRVADSDVSFGNAVASLRGGEWRPDLAGRVLAVGLGVCGWVLLDPLGMEATGAGVVVAANLGVLVADPLWFAVHRVRNRQTETQSMTQSHAPAVRSDGGSDPESRPATDDHPGGEY